MQIFRRYVLFLILSLPLYAHAANQPVAQFTLGKDYQTVTSTNNQITLGTSPKGKVQVVEFFSYGCPACNRLEPLLEKWLQNKPGNIDFNRVPVVFEEGWGTFAKAYYTAKALGISEKITPSIFNAIHQQGLNLTSDAAMQQFFLKQGVSQKDFISAFNYSPTIALEVNQANTLMTTYQVMEIPTFIVAGKYKTSAGMVNGNNAKLLQIVDFLVQKEAKSLS